METLPILIVFLIYLYIGQSIGSTCPLKKFGDNCQYDCHCKNQNDCITGQCHDCLKTYSGSTCQKENIALGKHSVQSSFDTFFGTECKGSLAVDGNTNGDFWKLSCTHTDGTELTPPWWYVDLGQNYRIRYLKIYNRHEDYYQDIPDRIKGFVVYVPTIISHWVNKDICYTDTSTGHAEKIYDIECTAVMTGRYIGIQLRTMGILTLCEVEVYACVVGWYGKDCNKECSKRHCKSLDDPCDITNDGYCPVCRTGYYGIDCTKPCPRNCNDCHKNNGNCISCKMGFYGIRNKCTKTCSSRHCTNMRSACSPTGRCDGDCREGWYRQTCDRKCPINCFNNTCSQKGGKCIFGCRDGYFGDECQQQCVGCKHDICVQESGECTIACIEGTFGRFCNKTCVKECIADNAVKCERNTGHCIHCITGRYGRTCDKFCNKACVSNQTGKSECDQESGSCLIGCIKGFHGTTCEENCSRTCKKNVCDQHTAKCTFGCIDGWRGANCETCDDGWYGKDCNKECSKRHCNGFDDRCDITDDGKCGIHGCIQGWKGDDCTCPVGCEKCNSRSQICLSCPNGWYGTRCNFSCNARRCYHGTSHCPMEGDCFKSQCESGWKPPNCTCPENCLAGECDSEKQTCKICETGWYGSLCNNKCDHRNCENSQASCLIDGYCPVCRSGYYGIDCTKPCPRNCDDCHKNSGDCLSCKMGFYDTRNKCKKTCSDRHCSNMRSTCPSNGWCEGACREGWYKKDCSTKCQDSNCRTCDQLIGSCEICNDGFWGKQCDRNCPINCLNHTSNQTGKSECDQESGSCLIGCIKGFHGTTCEKNCSQACNKNECNQHTAKCIFGCIVSRGGANCESEDSDNGASIAGIVIGLIVLIVFVLALLFAFRKWKNSQKEINDKKAVKWSKIRANKNKKKEQKSPIYENTNSDIPGDIMLEEDGATYINQSPVKMSPTAIAVGNLWQYTRTMKSNGELQGQFRELPSGMVLPHNDSMKPANRTKNRYKNICAYDHSRVKLNVTPGSGETDYINACYVDGYQRPKQYIASQGPTDFTLNDFWRMIWDVKASKAVMLANLIENRKQKCEMYWPPKVSDTRRFGIISVTLVKEDIYADFTIRILHIKKDGMPNGRTFPQFHFTSWPDQDVPRHSGPLLNFRNEVNHQMSEHESGPTVVHCSAGVGRTGTFIAIDYLTEQGVTEGYVDVLECAKSLREQRVNMIQVVAQYIFLHDAITESLNIGRFTIGASEFPEAYRKLLKNNPMTGKSFLAEEYDALEILSPHSDAKDFATAKSPENLDKNRYKTILAGDSTRPFLSTPVKGTTDYINAISISGYREKGAFIITQTPLPHTVVDLYRLISEQHTKTIVNMDDDSCLNETVGVYWPQLGETFEFGRIRITTLEFESNTHFTTRTLEIVKPHYANHKLKQFNCKFWPTDRKVPDSAEPLLAMMDAIKTWKQSSGNEAIIIHCMTGAERSGLYCAISMALDKLNLDKEVSIPLTITQLRSKREHLVRSQEQFQFCHEAILTYLESFQMYSNFS